MKKLVRNIRRSKRVQKWVYNSLNRALRHNRGLQTLNCGLIPADGYRVSNYRNQTVVTRLGLELYHYVAEQAPDSLKGMDILEIGCGRGGGTDYLTQQFSPNSMVGIDFSSESIRICRDRYQQRNLKFLVDDATCLSFAPETFDLSISIETAHMIDDKFRFFSESHRTLKPGGHFMFLDFIYTNESSAHSIGKVETAMTEAGLEQIDRRDLTAEILKALETAAPIRETLIEKNCPRLFRTSAHEFCMTLQSNAFRGFAEGRTKYYFYTLKKPD